MAQVKIYGLKGRLGPRREMLSDAIHDALMAAFGLPPEKRFHRFIHLDRADFIHPADRSEDYTIIEISAFEGRSRAAKRLLINEIYVQVQERAGISPQDLEITLFETPRGNWGIRGKPGDELELPYTITV
jgi:phenylpyruvate tautomerase PptA (4-oxalocrotonate tautomerase family)